MAAVATDGLPQSDAVVGEVRVGAATFEDAGDVFERGVDVVHRRTMAGVAQWVKM